MTKELKPFKDILGLPPEKRLEAVLNSSNPAALVRSMPEEEVWLTIKKLGPHDALAILANTSVEQVQYILDIEFWKKDRFIPEQSLTWLSHLKDCGEEKVLEWVHETDADSVILALKDFIHVKKKETSDDNPLEHDWPYHLAPQTMDGSYYYQALSERADEVVRPIFEIIAKNDHAFFMKLCNAMMAEIRSNLEEAAFTWRTKRLSEKGFVSIEEALEVYRYLNDRQMSSLPKRQTLSLEETEKAALYPLALGGEEYPVLMLALGSLKNDEVAEDVAKEIATLANKVIMADGRAITPETITACLKKVMAYVNIGLEHLSGADIHKAGDVLRERWTMNLFQIGFSLVSRLRQHAKKFLTSGWPAELGGDLTLLEPSLASKINALLRRRPLYFSGEFEEPAYRDFKSVDEAREVNIAIEKAEFIGDMIKGVFKVRLSELKSLVAERENMTFSTILLTAWAKGVVSGNYKFAPLTEEELKLAVKKVFGKENKGSSIRAFKMDSPVKFHKWLLEHQLGISKEEEKLLKGFLDECFNGFIEEFSELLGKKDLDRRFIQSVWVVPSAD
ncbi:MAG: hypothetical protein COV46_00195 [Deltaproteobacteria bacterium CG11_big_fil_rev_8_21_14_0_20_49_13]|nr:MAG: hypothetical protein COV46_00195 [Deltaproteobacteria bacterium CG11_big_fil_rev_8_21_14_0_20_49_13]